jgi:hypothetical protein
MPVPRFAVIPLLFVAGAIFWIAANPGGATVESVDPTATPSPHPTRTPPPTATPQPPESLPDGLTGRLTYHSGGDVVTVEFPALDRTVVPQPEQSWTGEPSADGEWLLYFGCAEDNCVNLYQKHGATSVFHAAMYAHEWSPAGHTLAMITTLPGEYLYGQRLEVVEDPAAPQPRVLFEFEHGAAGITALRWTDRDSIVFAHEQHGIVELREIALDGSMRTLASGLAPVPYIFASPHRDVLAFTQQSPDGWRLMSLDLHDATTLRDLGNMGSDPTGTTPPEQAPPNSGKGPMYVEWSPDGTRLAFGGGTQPPYTMTVVDLTTGAAAQTEFPSGYPGEIRWSPDGALVAVSTYDIERTHHETWVVDPANGAGRHLMDGCVIVWSPDGRFLAVHGEDRPGIAVVDVTSGARGQLTHVSTDIPIAWME